MIRYQCCVIPMMQSISKLISVLHPLEKSKQRKCLMAVALVTPKLKQAAGEMWVSAPCLQREDPPHSLCLAPAQSAPVQSRSAEPRRRGDGAGLIRHSSAEQYMFEDGHIYISSGLFSVDPCMPNWPSLGSGSRQH